MSFIVPQKEEEREKKKAKQKKARERMQNQNRNLSIINDGHKRQEAYDKQVIKHLILLSYTFKCIMYTIL